jgi:preprotein translocase subunit SecG
MLFTFLLVVQAIVATGLIIVILMQKSEGGGLGVGGSPAGFLSARGAADFLSRATAVLAVAFVGLSIVLAVLASVNHSANQIDVDAASKLNLPPVGGAALPATLPTTAPGAPLAGETAAPAAATPAEPAPKGVPLQQ